MQLQSRFKIHLGTTTGKRLLQEKLKIFRFLEGQFDPEWTLGVINVKRIVVKLTKNNGRKKSEFLYKRREKENLFLSLIISRDFHRFMCCLFVCHRTTNYCTVKVLINYF